MPTFHKPHDQANRIRQTARQARVCRRTLPKREMDLSKREMSASYPENSCSTVPVPHLHYFRAGPRFDPGANIAPNCLGGWNGLENSEDCRSAGGHGNQHVRLRRAQIDRTKTVCPARSAIVASGRGRRPPNDFRSLGLHRPAISGVKRSAHGDQVGSRRHRRTPGHVLAYLELPIRRCDLSQLAAALW